MNILFFDDEKVAQLAPLTATRPAADLWLGVGALSSLLPTRVPAHLNHAESTLLVNGRVLFPDELLAAVPWEGPDEVMYAGEDVVALRWNTPIEGDPAAFVAQHANTLPRRDVKVRLGAQLWEYTAANGERITQDALHLHLGSHHGEAHPSAVLLNPESIHIGARATVEPGAVIDARSGPVIIAASATVGANAVIVGPVFIGEGAQVNPLSYIRSHTTVGNFCKVGGEIGNSIIMPYTHNQHMGYTGRSYIGSWCNIAGNVVTATIKNTVGPIKATRNGQRETTDQHKLGTFMGDYVTVGSGAVLSPGLAVGAHTNLVGSQFPDGEIPAFTWWEQPDRPIEYRLDKAVEVARRLKALMHHELLPEEANAVRLLFEQTEAARTQFITHYQ